MKGQFPREKHSRIINAHPKSGAMEISATDWMESPTREPRQGNAFSMFVIGGTCDELRAVFDELAGVEKDRATFIELHDVQFGTYGQFTDRYGVPWIFKWDKRE